MDTYDVVVIGYGPVGQMLSAQLGQAGHRVAAFERHAQLYGLSRAGHMDDEIMRTSQKSAQARSSARTRSLGSCTTCAPRLSAGTCC